MNRKLITAAILHFLLTTPSFADHNEKSLETGVRGVRDANGNRFLTGPTVANPGTPKTDTEVSEKKFPLPAAKSGIFYGDSTHVLEWPDDLLRNHIKELKDRGVTVLFMEAFRSTEQGLLNKYYDNPTDENFSAIVKKVKERGLLFGEAEQKLVKSAVTNRIRPVGIELPIKSIRLDERDNHWIATMNNYLEKHPGITWAAFVGSTHLKGGGFGADYVGVDERLKVPSVELESLRNPDAQ